ncbi:AMP-binding protein [Antarcticimicrobium sediminis]|uniref:AMP-binding protein n=1 Tax=Antarcticimicrobium sediminis TaxID=2546227 RepID=UPI0014047E69|nr:AMP-binding protein [Antarcticimicrobium sediminis]
MNKTDSASRDRLSNLVEQAPDDAPLFLIPGQPDYTYGQLRSESKRLAAALHARGIGRGDTVALCLGNRPEWMVAAFAAWRLGAAILALNPRFGTKEIGDLIRRTDASALVLDPGYRKGAVADAVRRIPTKDRASLELVLSVEDIPADEVIPGVETLALSTLSDFSTTEIQAQPQDVCLYLATSGTTSQPKIVQHIQNRVAHHCTNAAAAIGFDADSRTILAIPFCGGFGFAVAMTSIASGIPMVLLDTFEPEQVSRLINDLGVTHAMGTNDMLDKLLTVTPGDRPFPGLKMFGHANFTPGLTELPAEAERRAVLIRGFYGLSETLAFVAARRADAPLEERKEGGGTLTTPGAKLRIADPDTGAEQPEGAAGEVQILSPNVMVGYLNDPERTAATFTPDGYLRTGDLGLRGAGESFTFLTRMNDILRIGGYLVAPEEIEAVIKEDLSVDQCQVVSVTLKQGPRPVAFVVPAAGTTPDHASLIATCRAQLAIYKVPVRIFEINEIPVADGPNGLKVRKNVLRDIAQQAMADGLA